MAAKEESEKTPEQQSSVGGSDRLKALRERSQQRRKLLAQQVPILHYNIMSTLDISLMKYFIHAQSRNLAHNFMISLKTVITENNENIHIISVYRKMEI